MDDDGVLVYFYDIRDSLKVQPHNFFQYYHKDKSMRFVVRQVPLILGYALTVHTSQGMTLPSVHVDCEGTFAPGQISVALGRVRTKADISVSNFRVGLCPPHPPKVSAFYGTAGVSPAEDISCCRQNVHLPVVEEPDMDTSSTDTASDVDENEREFHLELDTPPPPACHLPDELKVAVLKPKILYPHEFTATQKKINNLINSTSDTALDTCVQHFYNELQLIANTYYNKHGDSKQINTVVQKFIQNFRKSEHFNTCLKTLFGTHTLINDHISIGVSLLLRIQNCFFSQSGGINPPTELISSDYTQNNSKVRYVAGMCVGRVISQYSNYLSQHCHENSAEVTRKKATVRGLQRYLYNTLSIAKAESRYPTTLQEISHRQYKYGHLTIVSDDLYEMFLRVDLIVHSMLHCNAWVNNKQDFFQILQTNVLCELYKNSEPIYEHLDATMMKPVISVYLRTCMKEMSHRITEKFEVKKKMAHRKQIMLEEATQSAGAVGTSSAATPIPSTSAVSSSTPAPSTSPPPSTAEANNDSQSPTSQANRKRPAEEIDSNTCAICTKQYNSKSNYLWVECTECKSWLHKKCDPSLRPAKRWRAVSQAGASYPCPICRKKGKLHSMLHP